MDGGGRCARQAQGRPRRQDDYIVEAEPAPRPIPAPPISRMDRKIIEYVVEEMKDGCCIQLGIEPVHTPTPSAWSSPSRT